MLKLILGRKQTGKTYTSLKYAGEAVSLGKQVVMLVPEQYSFECQRHLLNTFGPSISNKITIHSFTSLCEEIGTKIGGISGSVVDESTRFLLTKRAISNMRDNLKAYTRYADSSDFAKKMMSAISELKMASVTAEKLLEISKETDVTGFADKLNDISLVMSSYDALVKNTFIEPLDLIEKTVLNMQDNSIFKHKTFIIDEFKGFTEPQFKMLDRIIVGSDEVYATFCCDSLIKRDDTDIFANVKSSANRFVSIAKLHGVKVQDPLILESNQYICDEILQLEDFLAGNNNATLKNIGTAVNICRCDTVNSEVDFVLTEIKRLVREENYRYKDIVVISRNDSVYKRLLENVSENFEVPCYTDSNIPLSQLPFSTFILSSLKAALTFNTNDIIKFLKTGLFNLDWEDINRLENYVFLWEITGKKWLEKWNMSPLGLKKCDESEILEYEKLRQKIITPLKNLRNNLSGTATDMCRALLCFINSCGSIDSLKQFTEELEQNGKIGEAEYQRLGYDAFIKTLDKICSVLDNEMLSPEQFLENLSFAIGCENIGAIPQTKDMVIYGTADRIRPLRPKVVFVIGVNQDVFPAVISDLGLFTKTEREKLIEADLKISDFSIDECIEEQFLFYNTACSASDKVYLSYSNVNFDGTLIESSGILNSIISKFSNINTVEFNRKNCLDIKFLEAKEPSFEKLALNFFDDSDVALTLKDFFEKDGDYKDRINAIERAVAFDSPQLSSDTAKLLYGDDLRLSASKIDTFNSCGFMYFCRYGLGLERLKKVDFDPLTRGNIVHFILEKFINNHLNDIGSIEPNVIETEVVQLSEEFLLHNGTNLNNLDEKFNYMLSVLKDTAVFIVNALNNEFKQSMFKPKFCELKVGKRDFNEEGIDSIVVDLKNGGTVSLNGSIDRVDTTDDGKIRVVDYKTGTKDFKLSTILSGMNMQMMLYLYAAVKNGKDLLKADHPAGILYFPANKNISDEDNNGFIRMNGLVEMNTETVLQMEKEGKGKIIPATLRSGGNSFYKSNSIVEYECFNLIFKYLELALIKIGNSISEGVISAKPLKSGDKLKCNYCDYKSVCCVYTKAEIQDEINLSTADTVEIMKQEVGENGN